MDPTLREDSEVFVRDQGGFRNKSEYTYNGWRNIDIVLNLLLNLVLMLLYNLSMQSMCILLDDQCVKHIVRAYVPYRTL